MRKDQRVEPTPGWDLSSVAVLVPQTIVDELEVEAVGLSYKIDPATDKTAAGH